MESFCFCKFNLFLGVLSIQYEIYGLIKVNQTLNSKTSEENEC